MTHTKILEAIILNIHSVVKWNERIFYCMV